MARITLRAGRVQPVWAGHPWVFAQAIERVDGAPAAGAAVEVVDPRGNHLGRGFWSPDSAIPVRLVTRRADEALDDAALVRRVEAAAALRRALHLPTEGTDGYRLVHAEGDSLPGVIVDVYRDVAVVQILTVGMKAHEETIFAAVSRASGARTIVEVPGGRAQEREGLAVESRTVRGPEARSLQFQERGFAYEIDLGVGQKTGFYFDQRDNRALVESLAQDRRVLDLYSFVGSFSLAAARGGAREVRAYDSSATVVAEGARIAHTNGFGDRIAFARGDVRRVLSELIQNRERFDLVLVDPPKLAPSVKHLPRAQLAYRRLNARAMEVVAPGGFLLTCSCSGALKADDLVRLLAMSARDAGREITLLSIGQQGVDHPVPAAFPEGRYLKSVLLRVA